jgi:hypothetical protein
VGKDVGKKEPSYIVGRNVNKLIQTVWKTVWTHLKKLKMELPYDSAIPLLRMYLKECKPSYNKGTCTPMFIVALFTIAKLWKQQDAPPLTNGLRKYCIYVQWNCIQS